MFTNMQFEWKVNICRKIIKIFWFLTFCAFSIGRDARRVVPCAAILSSCRAAHRTLHTKRRRTALLVVAPNIYIYMSKDNLHNLAPFYHVAAKPKHCGQLIHPVARFWLTWRLGVPPLVDPCDAFNLGRPNGCGWEWREYLFWRRPYWFLVRCCSLYSVQCFEMFVALHRLVSLGDAVLLDLLYTAAFSVTHTHTFEKWELRLSRQNSIGQKERHSLIIAAMNFCRVEFVVDLLASTQFIQCKINLGLTRPKENQ